VLEKDFALLKDFFRFKPASVRVVILEHLPLWRAQDPESNGTTVVIVIIRDEGFAGVAGSLRITSAPTCYGSTIKQDLGFLERII
jgi:hypothetical protein